LNLRIAKPTWTPNPDGVDPTKVRPQGRNDLVASLSVGFIPRGGTTHGLPLRGRRDAATERRAQGPFEGPQGTKKTPGAPRSYLVQTKRVIHRVSGERQRRISAVLLLCHSERQRRISAVQNQATTETPRRLRPVPSGTGLGVSTIVLSFLSPLGAESSARIEKKT